MESLGIEELLVYKNKKVLITGHTGFKGSWLSIWLNELGAEITGMSFDPNTERDNFVLSNISSSINDLRGDIRNKKEVFEVFNNVQPEIVFHMAAQSLVLDSYENPLFTYETNTLGTANILEAIRNTDSVQTAIMITTDKVYQNKEWIWGYRENEPIGGYDPYSASKGAADVIINSYRNSFFNLKNYNKHRKSLSSVRAGNVIGGGDWSKNRIIPDCIKAIENNELIEIRNPSATRPWQHVLEPLGGYLLLGAKMIEFPNKFSDNWNFGPTFDNIFDVRTLVNSLINNYNSGDWIDISKNNTPHEAHLLSLDISKAYFQLGWKPVLNFEETISYTTEWYKECKTKDVYQICKNQIKKYSEKWNLLKRT